MLRVLIENNGAFAPTIYKNGEESTMKTGMGVVLNVASGEAEFASAASDANIYVVDKERSLAGVETLSDEPNDYADFFNEVKAGEFVKLRKFSAGEMFAVDQYKSTSTFTAGSSFVKVGTDGIWDVIVSDTSKYLFAGWEYDGGYEGDTSSTNHKLAKILVLE